MSRIRYVAQIAASLVACGAAALTVEPRSNAYGAPSLVEDARSRGLAPLPPTAESADAAAVARVELGRRLFFENRVSADGNVSCGHCHQSDRGGADGLPKAIGVFGKENPRNAPSIFNAFLQFKQHWRGDRASLEEQAEKSPTGPATFGNPDFAAVTTRIKAIPGYAQLFARAFPGEAEPITQKNWGVAIAAYERTLATPSRFDEFLTGKESALSEAEKNGLRKFIELGCASCHDGPGLGGQSFQKFGVYEDYWKETGVAAPDKGRAEVTKNDADLYVFKVPQLRNVTQTAPYFHDGSVADLQQAVRIMAKTQLGVDLKESDARDLVSFLGSLSGSAPRAFAPLEPFPDK
ncbi:MAG TPA: cytochrome c peroxidase [Methylocystis sp.]|nr:cytochrome c peroxidase [Methylocystis sp.]